MPLTGSAALMHAHHFSPPAHRGNCRQHIVHNRHKEDRKAQHPHNEQLALRIGLAPVNLTYRYHAILRHYGFSQMRVGVLLHCLLHTSVHDIHITWLLQPEKNMIDVVRSPCACPISPIQYGVGKQNFVGKVRIAWYFPINTPNGDIEHLLYGKLLAYGILITEDATCHTL